MLLLLSGSLYTVYFNGSNNVSTMYIGDSTNPHTFTSAVINNTIRITASSQYIHWLGIVYGSIATTIQSILGSA